MNHEFFHRANGRATGCGRRFVHELSTGCARLLQLFEWDNGMLTGRDVALQKRELEAKLLAAGYSRKLALIAVSEAFRPTAQPEFERTRNV